MNKYNLNLLANCKSICLIGHINPDADAIASMAVLKNFLIKQFKIENVDIFAECSTVPINYTTLLLGTKLNPTPKQYSAAIILDTPNMPRLGKYQYLFNSANKKIVIDHHATNNLCGDEIIVENVSSTCEIIYKITQQYKYALSNQECENIYAGIITDTNNLTVGNFDATTFKIISEIANKINTKSIYAQYFANNSIKSMRILAKSIENLQTFCNGAIIYSYITKQYCTKNKIVPTDFDGVINKLSTISNNKLVCLIYPKNNNFYVSMRAKMGYDVATIAKKYGGGGHVGAAAFLSNIPIKSIKEIILKEFKLQIKNRH